MANWGLILITTAVVFSALYFPRLTDHESYLATYQDRFAPRSVNRDSSEFYTVELYDKKFLNWKPTTLNNDDGQLAWGVSYRMSSLNEMFRYTGDREYLESNLYLAQVVVAGTDSARGVKTWQGQSGPVWSSLKFGAKGRTDHLVHTAMITFPILDLLHLSGPTLSPQEQQVLLAVQESLAAHSEQWRAGPAKGEGYFVYSSAQGSELAGSPLPINRNCAMAKSLWLLWKLTGDEVAKNRALGVARYFKNRLKVNQHGGYYWAYVLEPNPSSTDEASEDSSHAALTASLAPLLYADGQVFDRVDLIRFSATIADSVLADGGIINSDLQATGRLGPEYIDFPARWLEFAPYRRSVYRKLERFYEERDTDANPHRMSLATALFLRFRPTDER